MKLLILGTTIIATGDLAETDAEIRTADAIYPKHVIPGWQIVEVMVPGDFTITGYTWGGAGVVKKADSPEAIQAAKVERKAECDRLAKQKRDAIVANISPAEMASWPIKRAEALAYQLSSLESDAPNVAAEAAARGVPTADLVARVLAKAQALAALEAQIAGVCGKHQDALSTLTTVASIDAYDIKAGWPE